MATYLEIITQIQDELGLPRSSSVSAGDLTTRQLTALANREGGELMKNVDWNALEVEYVIEFGAPLELVCDTVAGSRIVTTTDTSGITPATHFAVQGQGVQIACRVASVDSATQVTLTENAEETQTGVTLQFIRDTFPIPADFDHYIDQTHWDRKFQWSMIGPDSPQTAEWLQSGIVTTGPRRRYRTTSRPAAFRIWPPPVESGQAPGTLVFQYISNAWVTKADGSFAGALTDNDDTVIFPDGLLQLGVKWRFFQIKGFDYAPMQREYLDWVDREKARKGGMMTLSLNKRYPSILISPAHVQDGNFPG